MLGGTILSASAYDYLLFCEKGGAEKTISTTGLTISFSNGSLLATSAADENLSIPLESLSFMKFSDTTSAETAATTVVGKVKVYAVDGYFKGTFESVSKALATLESGIYIVKDSQGKTVKISLEK